MHTYARRCLFKLCIHQCSSLISSLQIWETNKLMVWLTQSWFTIGIIWIGCTYSADEAEPDMGSVWVVTKWPFYFYPISRCINSSKCRCQFRMSVVIPGIWIFCYLPWNSGINCSISHLLSIRCFILLCIIQPSY